jgi:23S rRNA pseudouridine2605 synthase
MQLEDGPSAPAQVRLIRPDMLELTIREGRKRQVRRMCEQVGHPVKRLVRIGFGPLELGDLPEGAFRRLDAAETERLASASAGSAARRGRAS